MTAERLPLRHLLLVLAVVVTWGTNFVVVKDALSQFPAPTFVALRFLAASLPFLLFVPRPALATSALVGYGVLIGAGQSGLLCLALSGHIAPGIASALLQAQAFFTIGLTWLVHGERLSGRQLLAVAVCAAAVLVIIVGADGDSSLIGVVLVLGSAFTWACANLIVKRSGGANMLGVVVWSSVPASLFLVLEAVLLDGIDVIRSSIENATTSGWIAIAWQAIGNTLFGYGVWNWLLTRHSAAAIVPFGMLVPVVGMTASFLLLGEHMPPWKLFAAALILAGLAINSLPFSWPTRGAAR